jgi:hypothetical protein
VKGKKICILCQVYVNTFIFKDLFQFDQSTLTYNGNTTMKPIYTINIY